VTDGASDVAGGAALGPRDRLDFDSAKLVLAHWRASLGALAVITAVVAFSWNDHAPLHQRARWCALVLTITLCQALLAWRMERAALLAPAIVLRCLPWLTAAVGLNGLAWGLAPWMALSAPWSTLLFAAMFNLMLLFSLVNAPTTPLTVLCAGLPLATLTTAALLHRDGPGPASAVCAVLFVLVILYGWRVQMALRANLAEHHTAQDLAAALHRNQQRLVEVERDRTLLLERQRLTRDIHDGLGSALTSALSAAEHGDFNRADMAALLRECIDDLRVVIDSLDPIDHDLVAVLASLRFRLGRRLQAAGVQLDWQMADLPALPWMGPSEALQVMRIIQEVLSNIVKHAAARHVSVSASQAGAEIEVAIVDDGRGFDAAAAPPGRGMRFMAQRAAALHGALRVDSTPGHGTQVRLRLPLQW